MPCPGGHSSPCLTQGSTFSVAAGRLVPDLSLCRSGKSDHFSLRFNFNFICKRLCHLEDVWHTLHQGLYRNVFLGNAFGVWVCGPKDDTMNGNSCQKLNELMKDVCTY